MTKKTYSIEDLKKEDAELLKEASFLPENGSFLCFGRSFYVLRSLGFVNNEYEVTPYGRQFVREYLKISN